MLVWVEVEEDAVEEDEVGEEKREEKEVGEENEEMEEKEGGKARGT